MIPNNFCVVFRQVLQGSVLVQGGLPRGAKPAGRGDHRGQGAGSERMDAGQKGSQQGGGLVPRCLRRPGNLKGIRGEEACCPEIMRNVQIWPAQLSSAQFKTVSMCSGKPTCAPSHLSEVSPPLSLR